MKYIDLTQTFTNDMPVWPGDEKDSQHIGTHMDAPMEMIAGGQKISEIALERFFGRGVLVDVRATGTIGPKTIEKVKIKPGDFVLFFTGFGQKFRDKEYYKNYPVLTEALAEKLAEAQIKAVGLDSPSPDKPPYEVHKILLKAGILIIENLTNLDKLPGIKKFEVIALPAKFDTEAAPVRVVAKINS